MKNLIMGLALFYSSLTMAKSYTCQFEDTNHSGKVNIHVNGTKAKLSLFRGTQKNDYPKCNAKRDDFGLLIDCSAPNVDLMLLINDDTRIITGGIMSSSFDLFLDLDC